MKIIAEYGREEIDPATPQSAALLVDAFRDQGFDVILNIGEPAENQIGSNCGRFVSASQASRLCTFSGRRC
jgi:hypothetical protein